MFDPEAAADEMEDVSNHLPVWQLLIVDRTVLRKPPLQSSLGGTFALMV